MAESMKRQLAEYQVERTAQFLYSFHYDLLARLLDKYWATVHADCLLLRPGEIYFLCNERAIVEYRTNKLIGNYIRSCHGQLGTQWGLQWCGNKFVVRKFKGLG